MEKKRAAGGEKPGFLHLDVHAEADTATHEIKTINQSGPKGGFAVAATPRSATPTLW